LIALKAESAALAATRAFEAAGAECSPSKIDDQHHRHLALFDEDLTNVSFMRAETFQSMVRTSSPGWYCRTSRKRDSDP
jgi:hypothetical protein